MTVEATASAETKPDGGASLLTDVLDAEAKNAHIRRVMSSSEDMTWATPQEWFDYLNLEFGFTLDPCCWPETAKCKRYYTPETDGLAQSWQDERVFMNPPLRQGLGQVDEESLRGSPRQRGACGLFCSGAGRHKLVAQLRGEGNRSSVPKRACEVRRGDRKCTVSGGGGRVQAETVKASNDA